MSAIPSTTDRQELTAASAVEGGATTTSVTLSERSITGLALVRIFLGFLWFQQLFWKLPPDFRGLFKYIVSESQHTFVPGYSFLLQHTFLAGCASGPNGQGFVLSGCTLFAPMSAFVWTGEAIIAICLLFGVFTRLGGLLSVLFAVQLYVGLAYAPGEWIWTYGMLVLLGLVVTVVPAGRRLGVDQWLAPRLQAARHNSRIIRWLNWLV